MKLLRSSAHCSVFVLLVLLLTTEAMAWERINVPGAKCGDGSDYYIYLEQGDPRKLAFLLMGGGACWDYSTCYGISRRAWVHSIPVMPDVGGITSKLDRKLTNPIESFTKVFFPYCTGDVHLGEHIARYKNKNVHHVGKLNIERSYNYLIEQEKIDFKYNGQFLMYGYSAGAIGSLYHFSKIDQLLPKDSDKVLVADAPGLHFGDTFWSKFPEAWVGDVDKALAQIGYRRNPWNGLMAPVAREICQDYQGWRFYFLQGSKDIIMSELFGEIKKEDHKRKVFGQDGIVDITSDLRDNCSSWVADSEVHTFLVVDKTATEVKAGGINSMEFLARALKSDPQVNYH